MLKLGLTGGIGMGKSTVAKLFAERGIACFNADDAVHALQAPQGAAIAALAEAFPGIVEAGVLNRASLRALVLENPAQMRVLEQIMHPLVRAARAAFLAQAQGRKAVLLDIPLLFETANKAEFDKVITVSCPYEIQLARVLARGLPQAQIEALIAKQMPDALRREKADYIIENGGTLAQTQAQVQAMMEELGL